MSRSLALGYGIACVLMAAAAPAVAADRPTSEGSLEPQVAGTELVGKVTGADSPNDTASRWGIHGTDLGHMFMHRDQLYMVFGDTFGAGGLGGRDWRSNAMARIADPDPRNGFIIDAMVSSDSGAAKELLPSRKIVGIERTVIPTYGISVDGRMYLHYMSVRKWGQPGRWDVRHSGFAYSDDDGRTWNSPAEAIWQGDTGFEQVAMVEQDDYLYSFGIPEGRYGGVRLRRVDPSAILDKGAYEYWQGDGWGAQPAAAQQVVPAPVGELSVAWSEEHERWVMMYLNPERRAIVLRSAPALTGPWGDEQVVVTANEHPGLYSPYIVPASLSADGLYFTMSLWDDYNVYLMRAQFEGDQPRIAPEGIIAEPGRGATGNEG